jgi:DNA mismatch repair protein MutS
MRKQTMVNAERFITPELKEYENKILGAQERSMALEYDLFLALREQIVAHTGPSSRPPRRWPSWTCWPRWPSAPSPCATCGPRMARGRHAAHPRGATPGDRDPARGERFVPNDTLLDNTGQPAAIITGPNMAGKSTYIRQVAVIDHHGPPGSFVPAGEAELGVVDRVFTRVGASDDLARGRSTFMVEMQETANILNNATPRSLIVLDEIGRGTSTFDGISIAWAVAEYLHNDPRRPRPRRCLPRTTTS